MFIHNKSENLTFVSKIFQQIKYWKYEVKYRDIVIIKYKIDTYFRVELNEIVLNIEIVGFHDSFILFILALFDFIFL